MELDVSFTNPVIVDRVEVLQWHGHTFVRVSSRDGASGFAPANGLFTHVRPVLLHEVIPFFVNKDVRDLPSVIDAVNRDDRFAPLRGMTFWPAVAWVEMAILDMLGNSVVKPVTELLGGLLRVELPVCLTGGARQRSPYVEVEIRHLSERLAATGARAVKLKLPTSGDGDFSAALARIDKQLAAARKAWDPSISVFVDANGAFTADEAIEVSHVLKAYDVSQFEDPCAPDDFEGTHKVADTIGVRVAWGRHESSAKRWDWAMAHHQADVFTTDVNVAGGLIRAADFSDDANSVGLPVSPHCGPTATDLQIALQLAGRTKSLVPFHDVPADYSPPTWYGPAPMITQGVVVIPTGPGLGMEVDASLWREASVVLT
jgi:L-alanine-DL-glutamate epimerase-like enolase superfamily enzyme